MSVSSLRFGSTDSETIASEKYNLVFNEGKIYSLILKKIFNRFVSDINKNLKTIKLNFFEISTSEFGIMIDNQHCFYYKNNKFNFILNDKTGEYKLSGHYITHKTKKKFIGLLIDYGYNNNEIITKNKDELLINDDLFLIYTISAIFKLIGSAPFLLRPITEGQKKDYAIKDIVNTSYVRPIIDWYLFISTLIPYHHYANVGLDYMNADILQGKKDRFFIYSVGHTEYESAIILTCEFNKFDFFFRLNKDSTNSYTAKFKIIYVKENNELDLLFLEPLIIENVRKEYLIVNSINSPKIKKILLNQNDIVKFTGLYLTFKSFINEYKFLFTSEEDLKLDTLNKYILDFKNVLNFVKDRNEYKNKMEEEARKVTEEARKVTEAARKVEEEKAKKMEEEKRKAAELISNAFADELLAEEEREKEDRIKKGKKKSSKGQKAVLSTEKEISSALEGLSISDTTTAPIAVNSIAIGSASEAIGSASGAPSSAITGSASGAMSVDETIFENVMEIQNFETDQEEIFITHDKNRIIKFSTGIDLNDLINFAKENYMISIQQDRKNGNIYIDYRTKYNIIPVHLSLITEHIKKGVIHITYNFYKINSHFYFRIKKNTNNNYKLITYSNKNEINREIDVNEIIDTLFTNSKILTPSGERYISLYDEETIKSLLSESVINLITFLKNYIQRIEPELGSMTKSSEPPSASRAAGGPGTNVKYNYYLKYIKYKNKYLKLKNMLL